MGFFSRLFGYEDALRRDVRWPREDFYRGWKEDQGQRKRRGEVMVDAAKREYASVVQALSAQEVAREERPDRPGESISAAAAGDVAKEIAAKIEEKKQDEIRYSRKEGNGIRFSLSRDIGPDVDPEYIAICHRLEGGIKFGRLLLEYVRTRCGGNASRCYLACGVSRQLYSKVISNPDRVAEKRTVMQLALGLRLSVDEAREFLSAAGYAFSATSYQDQAFLWCLEKQVYSLVDVNRILVAGGCKSL